MTGDVDRYDPAEPQCPDQPNSPVVRASSYPAMSAAEWAYERLTRQIAAFEEKLAAEEEVGGKVASGPGDQLFHIEDVGWWGPDMIMFYGRNGEGRPVQLIQHYTQLNVLLTPVRKQAERPARRIGFELAKRIREKVPVNQLSGERPQSAADSTA